MTEDAADPALEAAADELYGMPVEEFVGRRDELAKAAKAEGDGELAKAISRLRKPTAPAAVVNRFALRHPEQVARLTELGDRLRRAHRELAAAELRELTTERRALVAELADAALRLAEREDAPPALRDEVVASLDAAVADPDVARRLGRLLRPEHFSGFGVVPGPELTLVRGGSSPSRRPAAKQSAEGRRGTAASGAKGTTRTDATPAAATPATPAAPEPGTPSRSAASRRLARALAKARDAFSDADERHRAAESTEQRAHEQVTRLGDELAELQRELDTAKRELETARKEARRAKTARREARSALDRAERQADDTP